MLGFSPGAVKDRAPEENRKHCKEEREKKKAKEEKMKADHMASVRKAKELLESSQFLQDRQDDRTESARVRVLEEQLERILRIQQETEDERMALQIARDDDAT